MAKEKKSKNQLRREKLKLKKQQQQGGAAETTETEPDTQQPQNNSSKLKDDLAIVDSGLNDNGNNSTGSTGKLFESEMDRLLENPEYQEFRHIFDKFQTTVIPVEEESKDKGSLIESDDDDDDEREIEDNLEAEDFKPKTEKLSKRKLKILNKVPLAQLKSQSKYPDIVQWYDADAEDPYLNLILKQHKNSIPVPHHWQYKREYLASRRGIERAQFQLPQYILDTGILNMRDTTDEDDKTLKQKSREKVQPKMNRLDLDYKKLYDAFFKFQTKPRLYGYGELYYEGKDTGVESYKMAKYGEEISDELKEALGLGIGFDGVYPWVAKMRIYGPPPSYPWIEAPNDGDKRDNDDAEKDEQNEIKKFEPFGKLLFYESEEEEEPEELEQPEYEYDDEDEEEEEVVPVIEQTQEPPKEETPVIGESYEDHKPSSAMQTSVDKKEENEDEDEEDVPLATVSKEKSTDIEPKALYKVLKQKFTDDKNGVLNTGVTYEISSAPYVAVGAENGVKRKAEDANTQQSSKKQRTKAEDNDDNNDEEGDDEDEDEEDGKFKF